MITLVIQKTKNVNANALKFQFVKIKKCKCADLQECNGQFPGQNRLGQNTGQRRRRITPR